MGISLLPYSFLTYSTQIPSRQVYLASAGLALLVGLAAARLPGRRLAAVAVVVMLAHNVGYLWTKKRRQFEERAAPTAQLIDFAARTRGRIWVRCFPLPKIVAEEAVRLGAGRAPDSLVWTPTDGRIRVLLPAEMSWSPHLRLAAGVLLAYFAVYAETPNETARALLEAAQSSFAAGDFDRSYNRASEAAALFRGLKDVAGEVSALDTAASAQLRRGQYAGALDLFRAALVLDRERQDGKGEATHLSSIGDALFFQGKYLDAMESYEAALRRVEASAGEPWAAERRRISLSNLAILYEQLGEDARARDCFQAALDVPGISPGERGRVLSRLGTLYRRTGEGGKALEAYAAAQAMFAREHRLDDEVHTLQDARHRAHVELGRGRAGRALFHGRIETG